MSLGLVLPALVAVLCGTAAGLVRWPLRPMLAVRVLAGLASGVAITVVSVLVAAAAGFATRSALVLSIIEWCPVVPLQHQISYLEGAGAVIALAVIAVRVRRVLRRRRWAAEGTQGRRLSILDTAEPIAYAAPGDPGCVVVSRGLLDVLGPRERQVVLAHERAHLHQNHHRYLLAGELAVAVVPVLRPLVFQLRLATERSADESAAVTLGGDRRLVARAIARAATTHSSHNGLVGAFGGGSVPARVNALVGPPDRLIFTMLALGAGAMTTALAVAAGSLQAHHLAELIGHICHF